MSCNALAAIFTNGCTDDRGYECCIIMPDDVAVEKVQVLEKFGAKVERVRPGESIL